VKVDRRTVLLATGALTLGVGAYFALRPTDESRIREKIAKLAAAVRITDADLQANPIGRLSHVSGIFQTIFDQDVRVSIPELIQLHSGRRELEELVTAAPRYVRSLDVEIGNIKVKLDDAHTSAEVDAVADVSGVERDGRKREDKRAVDFQFVKQDGDWIITTMNVWSREDAAPQ
jgi:hypothetical protein